MNTPRSFFPAVLLVSAAALIVGILSPATAVAAPPDPCIVATSCQNDHNGSGLNPAPSIISPRDPGYALNPQPLPPGRALNPQPLPPGHALKPGAGGPVTDDWNAG
jgi:hypothetical protein